LTSVFAIISVLITVIVIIANLNENEASVREIFGMFFTLISFSAIVALVKIIEYKRNVTTRTRLAMRGVLKRV